MPEGVPPAPPGPGDDAPAPGQPMPGPDAQLREGDRQYARAPEVSIRLPESLKSVTRSHWLALVLSQGAAYVTLLLVALLALVGLIIGLLLSGEDALSTQAPNLPAGTDLAPSGALLFITLPFQIAALWLLGTFGFNASIHESVTEVMPAGTDMGGNLWAPNLLFLAIAAAVALWVGRTVLRRSPQAPITAVPRLGRLIANLASALVMAGATLLVTWVVSYRQSFSLVDFAALEGASESEAEQLGGFLGIDSSETVLSLSGNAAGASVFLTAFLFYLVIGLVLSVGSGFFARVRKRVEYVLPSASAVPRALATHVLMVTVPVVIYLAVDFTIRSGAVGALSIFFWAWPMALFSFVMLNFSAVSMHGGMSGFGQSEFGGETLYLWTGDFAWWEIVLGLLLGVAAIAVTSLVWSLRRDSRGSTLRNLLSWVPLPLGYALLGAVLTIFGQFRGAGDLLGVADMSFRVGPGWWTFLVLLLVGLIIEGLSRFAVPLAELKLPSGMRRALGGPRAQK